MKLYTRNMKNLILFFATFLFLLLSLLNYHWAEQRFLWMTSIIVMELSYLLWIAPFLFFLYIKDFRFKVLNIISLILFIYPIFSNIKALQNVQSQNPWIQSSLISTPKLLTGWAQQQIEPKQYSYSQIHNLSFDFYPAQNCEKNCPFAIVIHGGGWSNGDKTQLPFLNSALALNGVAVFSISYRLVPNATWPSQKEDVNLAIDYIQSNSDMFNINPRNYALIGRSAGSQLAGVVAYTRKDPGIKAYVNFYGPTDLIFGYEIANEKDLINSKELLVNYMNGSSLKNRFEYLQASPLHLVSENSPATLSFHGHLDPLCWYKHAERLHKYLEHYEAENTNILIPYATHGFDYFYWGISGQASTQIIKDFLKAKLL